MTIDALHLQPYLYYLWLVSNRCYSHHNTCIWTTLGRYFVNDVIRITLVGTHWTSHLDARFRNPPLGGFKHVECMDINRTGLRTCHVTHACLEIVRHVCYGQTIESVAMPWSSRSGCWITLWHVNKKAWCKTVAFTSATTGCILRCMFFVFWVYFNSPNLWTSVRSCY